MLYLLQPQAKETVLREVETMLQSKVRNLYVSFLIDGTFGGSQYDLSFAESVIHQLNAEGRTLTLAIYFVSGPTMRRWETTPIETYFSKGSPRAFRYLIQNDPDTQSRFKEIVQRAVPLFDLNRSLSPSNKNISIVMLEDNLDNPSYRATRRLAAQVLGDTRSTFIRNPCPGCFSGNTTEPFGDSLEFHSPKNFQSLRTGDGVTLDGNGIRYEGDAPNQGLSVEDIKSLLIQSISFGNQYFGLWRAERQGLGQNTTQSTHPNQRSYEIQTPDQRSLEIELLRYGLNPE